MVGLGGQFGALAGLKVQYVGPLGIPLLEGQLPGLLNESAIQAEGLVALLGPGDGLEDQVAGAPLRTASIWVVTWASTQIWVGMFQRSLTSWNRSSTRRTLSTESSTGLSPSTASPAP